MNTLQSLVLGIVEGLTEFLPISSTFHLIWAAKLLNIPPSEFLKTFEIFIQSGAILAVALLYFKEILTNFKLFKNIVVSFIPTALVGFMFYRTIKNVFFENYTLQIIIFVLVGIIFIVYEKKLGEKKYNQKTNKSLSQISIKDAILIGLFQSLAIFPGVSRAGAVIIGMMILKYNRIESAKYSFMLAIPTILAASVLDLLKTNIFTLSAVEINLLSVGFISSFISAIFVVGWFIRYLQHKSLKNFGWYRIIVSLLLLSFL